MKTYTPKGIEIFKLTASDFLTAGEGDWRAERLAENVTTDEESPEHEAGKELEAENLAGFYWWTCSPGCLPDSEASGPFDTWDEANEDAGGGEYEEAVLALAAEIDCDPAEIEEESHDYYGMTVLSYGRQEYAVGTDEEADEAWDQSLDSYLDDSGVLDSIPENLQSYFDREAWKSDAKMDGRGHALASYDGDEMELSDGYVAFRIN